MAEGSDDKALEIFGFMDKANFGKIQFPEAETFFINEWRLMEIFDDKYYFYCRAFRMAFQKSKNTNGYLVANQCRQFLRICYVFIDIFKNFSNHYTTVSFKQFNKVVEILRSYGC